MRVRLLKVVVQPVFVIEDGDGYLEDLATDPVTVSAKEWPTFATERFAEMHANLADSLAQREPLTAGVDEHEPPVDDLEPATVDPHPSVRVDP